MLVGYYEGRKLMFASKVRAGLTPHTRTDLFALLKSLAQPKCPFANLPSSKTGHWGEGITAEDMAALRWVSRSSSWRCRLWSGRETDCCVIPSSSGCGTTRHHARSDERTPRTIQCESGQDTIFNSSTCLAPRINPDSTAIQARSSHVRRGCVRSISATASSYSCRIISKGCSPSCTCVR